MGASKLSCVFDIKNFSAIRDHLCHVNPFGTLNSSFQLIILGFGFGALDDVNESIKDIHRTLGKMHAESHRIKHPLHIHQCTSQARGFVKAGCIGHFFTAQTLSYHQAFL